jgi:neutral ceramidase
MLHVGFGVGDITPEAGMEIPGGFQKHYSKGAREPLLAVACVLHDGKQTAALVGIDAVAILKSTVAKARDLIEKETKVPGAHVLIGASHTHTGGPVIGTAGSDEDRAYTDILAKRIASAVSQAWRSLHAAEVGIGTGKEETIAFNRRFLMRDGREITHPGKPGTPHHADIIGPAGPTDPNVGVLAARGPDRKVIGVVVHFTCHSTVVGGDLYSPDYAGYLRKHIKARYGEETPVVFLLGACGDITQVDNLSTAVEFGVDHADMMGQKLAAETIRTIGRMTWNAESEIAVATETPRLAIRPEPDPAREKPAFGLGSVWDVEYARERALLAAIRRATPELSCEVQAVRVGPLGIVTNGAEYFCEYGLRIKSCSPFRPTWVVSLANEYIGYVPAANGFVAGGYEPRTARSSMMAIDTGQKLVESALKALQRVAPEPGGRAGRPS